MLYTMPRIVADQRSMFESNELFRRLSSDSEIKYIGYISCNLEERRARFQTSCRNGRAEIAFVNCGLNLILQFFPWSASNTQNISPSRDYVNFDVEPGKVHLKAPFILNGVCVCYKGWIDVVRLDGMGHIEFDSERAQLEETQLATTSSQQISKVSLQKVHSLKHPASGGNPTEIDKRPRLQ